MYTYKFWLILLLWYAVVYVRIHKINVMVADCDNFHPSGKQRTKFCGPLFPVCPCFSDCQCISTGLYKISLKVIHPPSTPLSPFFLGSSFSSAANFSLISDQTLIGIFSWLKISFGGHPPTTGHEGAVLTFGHGFIRSYKDTYRYLSLHSNIFYCLFLCISLVLIFPKYIAGMAIISLFFLGRKTIISLLLSLF